MQPLYPIHHNCYQPEYFISVNNSCIIMNKHYKITISIANESGGKISFINQIDEFVSTHSLPEVTGGYDSN